MNAPLAVTWAEGKNMDFYVAVGGRLQPSDADKGRAYVTQPSGKVESVHRRFLLPDGKPQPLRGRRRSSCRNAHKTGAGRAGNVDRADPGDGRHVIIAQPARTHHHRRAGR